MALQQQTSSSDAWTTARNRFVEDLSDGEKVLYSNATIESIFYEASVSEKSHRTQSSGRRLATDALKPLVTAIEQYGRALDVFSNSSPLILGPLWGSLRVILHITRQFGEYFDKIVEMLARIGDIIPRCRDYERLFRTHGRLLQAISVLYLDILMFCSDVKDLFRKARRPSKVNMIVFSRSIWKSFKERFGQQMSDFREHRDNVDKEANVSHMLEEANSRALAEAKRVEDAREKRAHEHKRILSMLNPVNYAQKQSNSLQHKHPGTCRWIWENQVFQHWLNIKQTNCLIVHGIPGSGKTILASFMIDELSVSTATNKVRIAFHYFDYTNHDSLKVKALLESLLHQLLRVSTISEAIMKQIRDVYGNGERIPTATELETILVDTLALNLVNIVILDGIDECDVDTQHKTLDLIARLLNTTSSCIKIVLSCQSSIHVKNALPFCQSIQLSPLTLSRDIEPYIVDTVRSHIKRRRLVLRDCALEQDIVAKLIEKAHGMFLWVTFQLQDLCAAASDAAIRETLDDLPIGLYETYVRKVNKVKGDRRSQMVQRIFKWLTCARRPLLAEELQEAVAFDRNDEIWTSEKIPHLVAILQACQNLVVKEQDGTVCLAHHSVLTFLLAECTELTPNPFRFKLLAANRLAAEVCVAYLSFGDFQTQIATRPQEVAVQPEFTTGGIRNIPRVLGLPSQIFSIPYRLFSRGSPPSNDFPEITWSTAPTANTKPSSMLLGKYRFLEYAVENWEYHTSGLSLDITDEVDQIHHKTFDQFHELAMTKTLAFAHRSWGQNRGPSHLPYLTMFDWAIQNNHLALLYLVILVSSTPIEYCLFKHKSRLNPFVSICQHGFSDLLSYLLEVAGWYLGATTRSELLIWCAAFNGHYEIAQILIDQGIVLDQPGMRPGYIPAAPFSRACALHVAAWKGHESVLRLLLARGASAKVRADHGNTAIFYASNAQIGHMLLQKNCGNPFNSNDDSPLHTAAFDGRQEIVRLFIQEGLHTNSRNKEGRLALHCAAGAGHSQIVEDLCSAGVSAAKEDHKGYSPLALAAERGHYSVVDVLLSMGLEVNASNYRLGTALHRACAGGHLETSRLLLERGSNTNASDVHIATPLHIAAQSGHTTLLQLLIDHGASISLASVNDGWTALHTAAARGRHEAVKTLLNAGSGINIMNSHGETALYVAVLHGHARIVELLLEHGPETPISTFVIGPRWRETTTTLSQLATKNGHFDIAKTLEARLPLLSSRK